MSAYKVMKLSAATGSKGMHRDCGYGASRTLCVKVDPTPTVEVKLCICNTAMCNSEFDLTRISQRIFLRYPVKVRICTYYKNVKNLSV